MEETIAPIIATITMFLGIGWMVKVLSTNKRLDRLAKMHNDLQIRLLDKLGSSQEVLAYLNSEAGKKLLEPPADPSAGLEHRSPYARILFSVQAGTVLALVGLAFLALRGMVSGLDDTGFAFLGLIALALGIGFVISAAAAHLLSKRYGLINGHGRDGGQ